jgi:hypothetical protein
LWSSVVFLEPDEDACCNVWRLWIVASDEGSSPACLYIIIFRGFATSYRSLCSLLSLFSIVVSLRSRGYWKIRTRATLQPPRLLSTHHLARVRLRVILKEDSTVEYTHIHFPCSCVVIATAMTVLIPSAIACMCPEIVVFQLTTHTPSLLLLLL